MRSEPQRETEVELRKRARHVVYERFAFLSTAIWVLGTLLLFVNTVPVTARPGPQIMISMLVPLIPAALPWLIYVPLSNALARRWATRQGS